MKKKIPKECKNCPHIWTHGIKDNIHDMWCTEYQKPVYKAIGMCKLEKTKKNKK